MRCALRLEEMIHEAHALSQLDSRSGPGQRAQFRRGVGGARQHSDAVGHLGHLCLELFFDGLHFHHGGGVG